MHAKTVVSSAILVAASAAFLVQARAAESGVKAAFLARETRPLQASVVTAEQLLAGQGLKATEAEVVVVGPAIQALKKGSKQQKMLEAAMKKGVRIVACEMAMKNAGVKKSQLIPGVETVANGFTEIFVLQQKGFETLVL